MLLYVFLISFLICVFLDYLYLYAFFDSKLFMKSLGAKLEYVLNTKNSLPKNSQKKLYKINFKRLFKLCALEVISVILSVVLFKNIIFSNFVVLDIGYKKIELVSTFENYWKIFIFIYYLAFALFIYIIFNRFTTVKKKAGMVKEENSDVLKNLIYVGKEKGNNVYLKKEELYKNLLITGSIGTGKTSSAINKFTKYMITNNISGLIIDIKGNYVETVDNYMCKNENYEYVVISDENDVKYNPISSKVKSIEMANRLRRVLELISTSNSSDPYWLDKVENVLFNLIVLIKYTDITKLDFKEIHTLVTDDEYLKQKMTSLTKMDITNFADEKAAHEIKNMLMFFQNEYFGLEKRIQTIIKSEITRLTIPFVTDYEMCKRYGVNDKDSINISFKNNKPKLIVLSMNMSKNFLISKILSAFVKLEFQSFVLENIKTPIETFCICDEYQEFANVQDAHFLSLSREAKCMNIYSMQSYTSLINILKNEHAAKVIIQNMVNKIWFRNDDNYTVEEVIKQIGKEKKLLKTSSVSEGAEETKKSIFKGFKNKKSNISESISYAESTDYILNEKTLSRELATFEALVLFSDNGKMSELRKVKMREEEDYERV